MKIEFYSRKDGTKPMEEFLDSLPSKLAAKTVLTISYLQQKGYQLSMPFAEKITDEIWELRTKQSNDITRVMYFFYEGDKAILTHGFIKKTQKTPKNEIQRALKYREDYYRRNKHG